jgi:hypothetical protein
MRTSCPKFACPIARYRGIKDPFSQEFNRHLQSFAHQVSLLACLHTGGKLPSQEAYQQLLTLWDELQPYLSLIADGEQNSMFAQSPLALNDSVGDRLASAFDAD